MCEQEIRELAYQKWEEAGYPQSDGISFWLEAEVYLNEVKTIKRERPKVAAKTSTSKSRKWRTSYSLLQKFEKVMAMRVNNESYYRDMLTNRTKRLLYLLEVVAPIKLIAQEIFLVIQSAMGLCSAELGTLMGNSWLGMVSKNCNGFQRSKDYHEEENTRGEHLCKW